MASPGRRPAKVLVQKKTVVKEDGRYIIFYTFASEAKPAKGKGKNCPS